eukprot:7400371-Pyramimonas_sp.AAC.1
MTGEAAKNARGKKERDALGTYVKGTIDQGNHPSKSLERDHSSSSCHEIINVEAGRAILKDQARPTKSIVNLGKSVHPILSDILTSSSDKTWATSPESNFTASLPLGASTLGARIIGADTSEGRCKYGSLNRHRSLPHFQHCVR